MMWFDIRKVFIDDKLVTFDILYRSYSDKGYAECRCKGLNRGSEATTHYYIEERN